MSDFDRSKYYKKKSASSQNKETLGGKSYYGRRSPNGKDSKHDTPKVKQPIILQKSREPNEDAHTASPKRVHKDSESVPVAPVEHQTAPVVKQMTKSVKFLDDSILCIENVQDFLQENSDFLVVGIVGPQGVGKSTVASLIAHNTINADLKKRLFKSDPSRSYEDDVVKIMTHMKLGNDSIKNEIFKIQSREEIETNSYTTRGIDLYITSNRVLILDCQPFNSVSLLEELVQSENKRSNLVSEFIASENSAEIQGLQLTAFMMSICHVLILVQDQFFDSNIVRFVQSAEMLKPTHSNPEDELIDHFPHLLVLQNKAQMGDFSPEKFRKIQDIYSKIFHKTKLPTCTNLGLQITRTPNNFNNDEEGSKGSFNLFLIPECKTDSEMVYRGHPPLEELIKRLRAKILGASKQPLTHIQLTEKTWFIYCSKVWDNVRKSSFFVEYTKLMP